MPRVNVKDRRRPQLIDANIASIARRGIAETTITHVSEGASMSRGIVNFYFDTKEAMMKDTLRTLVEDYTAHWQGVLRNKEDAAPQQQLKALIGANFDSTVCSQKRLGAWSAFWGHAASHKEYAAIIQAGEAQHLDAIESLWKKIMRESGRKQNDFPQQLHSMIRGMWLMLLVSPGLYDAGDLAQICFRAAQETAQPYVALKLEEKKVKPAANENKVMKLPVKRKKAAAASDRQLDFADLFG